MIVVHAQQLEGPERVTRILPLLFLGNAAFAKNPAALQRHSIAHVVTAAVGDGVGALFPEQCTYLECAVEDARDQRIERFFQPAADSIAAALAGGRAVLVHCQQGVSRSVTLLLYFLMDRLGWSLKKALLHVMRVRSSEPSAAYTHPNVGFLGQLQQAEARLRAQRAGAGGGGAGAGGAASDAEVDSGSSLTQTEYLRHFSRGTNLFTCLAQDGACGAVAEPAVGVCAPCQAGLPDGGAALLASWKAALLAA